MGVEVAAGEVESAFASGAELEMEADQQQVEVGVARPPDASDDASGGQLITQRYLLLTATGRWYLATDVYDPAFAESVPPASPTPEQGASADGPGVGDLAGLGDPTLVRLALQIYTQRSEDERD